MSITVVLPAKNEAPTIGGVVTSIRQHLKNCDVIVVDDGSTDGTDAIAEAAGAKVLRHPYSMGNGAAIKTGARAVTTEIIVFMDADGQHDPADIPQLVEQIRSGYDMVVGARSGDGHASLGRSLANRFYNWMASYMTGQSIPDLTSGFRAVRTSRFLEFLYLLPNGFSYPTTVTMAFFRAGYSVDYVPLRVGRRVGNSHINPLKDGIRFLIIIFKIGTLYSPLKLFVPFALGHAGLGIGYYAYTYAVASRLSLATVFLLSAAITIFLIGLVSEQITTLIYREPGR